MRITPKRFKRKQKERAGQPKLLDHRHPHRWQNREKALQVETCYQKRGGARLKTTYLNYYCRY